ncbi:MAG: hypothetical protein ACREQM_01805 [Candidatus Dormibacteraceae bacterium]
MQVPLRPGTELVCNCRGGHHATVPEDGIAPALPAGCRGSFWSIPRGSSEARVFGAIVSVGVIAPSSTLCAYLT